MKFKTSSRRIHARLAIYNTKEIVITRSNVKGYVIHPVEYNLGLWKTWIDK